MILLSLKRIEKSLLKLALEGSLSKLYRRSSPTLSAFNEISTYNEAIKEKRKDLEKELKKLESTLKKAPTCSAGSRGKTKHDPHAVIASEQSERGNLQTKQELKSQIQSLKKEIAKCKEIIPLMTMDCHEVTNATSRNDDLGYSSSSLRGEANHTPKTANRLPQVSSETLAMTIIPPFTIPNIWAWVKLGDICEIFTGATPKTSNAENFGDFIPFLNPGDIDNNGNVIYSNRGLTEKGLKEARKIEANSILVVCIGGLIGKACLVDRECTCNQQINVAKPFFAEAILLYYFINSAYFQSTIKANSTGTATPIINKNLFEQILIPLPPLCEQEHIVQILDTLFTLKKGLRVE